MKVLILGASGIVAQHMRLCVPDGIEPVWIRRTPDPITLGCDLNDSEETLTMLRYADADVIVNLAGESNVDVVERDPYRYERINVGLPRQLAWWCKERSKRLIQVSSQAVFSGEYPPYSAASKRVPINAYGGQKVRAEDIALESDQQVMRLTFILGIRPLPYVGRKNPLEAMIEGQSPQVADRFFSPLLAWDAAGQIWNEVTQPSGERIIHCGIPEMLDRFRIATVVNPKVEPCKHADFEGIAPRPVNTTYSDESRFSSSWIAVGAAQRVAANDRAIELALFFGITYEAALAKLSQGFHPLHAAVSDEWREFIKLSTCGLPVPQYVRGPHTEEEILDFYRTTNGYVWELSAYHDDPAWNYSGMLEGIIQCLRSNNCKRVLCLGDGIGDLTLACHNAGFDARYHDLAGSLTAQYAMFRFWRQTGSGQFADFAMYEGDYNAVVSLDFFEHCSDLPAWVSRCYGMLRPGGLLMSKNGFGCGSGQDGPIPMHLSVNDKYDGAGWVELCRSIGFEPRADAPDWMVKQ